MKDYHGKDADALKEKKLFLFDMDGTIYRENKLFDGVKELLQKIRQKGGEYVFITNNSSKSLSDYVKKVKKMGIPVTKENFYSSTQATVDIIKERHPNAFIYAQGTRSFIKELKKSGLKITTKYKQVDLVLLGNDLEVTGKKLRTTCEILTKQEVLYYATNPDWVCPVSFGYVPDCGSMSEGIGRCTGKMPIFIGKPEPTMVIEVMKKFGASKDETVVLGDRLYTDIASGVNAGVDTVCVLSGEVTIEEVENAKEGEEPTFVLNCVSEIEL